MDWKKVGEKQMVNHFYGCQHLSNKSFLAYHMAECGKEGHMPLQWSAAYQDLGELLAVVALSSAHSACTVLTEDSSWLSGAERERGAEEQLQATITEVETLLRVLDMDADSREDSNTTKLTHLLVAALKSKDVGTVTNAMTAAETESGHTLSDCLVGTDSVWIVKEVGSSCGKGISLCKGIAALLQLVEEMKFKCVVQKYIERPLLVRASRKFDIRQWVVVTSLQPLKVYGYCEFYCRLSKRKYNLAPALLSDPAMHLCNHAVQSKADEEGEGGDNSSSSIAAAAGGYHYPPDGGIGGYNYPHPAGAAAAGKVAGGGSSSSGGGGESSTNGNSKGGGDGSGGADADAEERQCDTMMNQAELRDHLLTLSPPVSLETALMPQIKSAAIQAVTCAKPNLRAVGIGFEWLGLDRTYSVLLFFFAFLDVCDFFVSLLSIYCSLFAFSDTT
jgi:hypothetical protein